MKRKLALMLTMTLLAGSLDSGMLVSAADFQQKRVWNRQWKRNCSQLRKTVLRN